MKRLITILVCAVACSCGGLDLSPEMNDFVESVEKEGHARAALKKYAGDEVKWADMHIYSFKNPRVIEEQSTDEGHCYTFEAEHRLTVRSYIICWQKQRIVSIKDRGMR